jgi:protein-disulfide isomerase
MNVWDPDEITYQRCPADPKGGPHMMVGRFTKVVLTEPRCQHCHRTAAQLRADARH